MLNKIKFSFPLHSLILDINESSPQEGWNLRALSAHGLNMRLYDIALHDKYIAQFYQTQSREFADKAAELEAVEHRWQSVSSALNNKYHFGTPSNHLEFWSETVDPEYYRARRERAILYQDAI